MKVKFLRDYQFYLPGDTRTLYNKKDGDVFEYDNEDVITKLAERGVWEIIEDKKPVKKVEKVVETPEDKQEEKEVKEVKKATAKKTTRRKKKK